MLYKGFPSGPDALMEVSATSEWVVIDYLARVYSLPIIPMWDLPLWK